ncbi:hypothetical protein V492_01135 [Pseudogymnoascus sp. VKM F-4246]|nr:hypothetical protein V492_01135 [Pseudogymnoascus sp. VKM F-4246]
MSTEKNRIPHYKTSPVSKGFEMEAYSQDIRSSESAVIPYDALFSCIEARSVDFQGYQPVSHLEDIQVVKYGIDDHFRPHFDWYRVWQIHASRRSSPTLNVMTTLEMLHSFLNSLAGSLRNGERNAVKDVSHKPDSFLMLKSDFEVYSMPLLSDSHSSHTIPIIQQANKTRSILFTMKFSTSFAAGALLFPALIFGAPIPDGEIENREDAAAPEPAYVWATPRNEKRDTAEDNTAPVPAYVWATPRNEKRDTAEDNTAPEPAYVWATPRSEKRDTAEDNTAPEPVYVWATPRNEKREN